MITEYDIYGFNVNETRVGAYIYRTSSKEAAEVYDFIRLN